MHDPYEAQNRQVHAFNKALDQQVFGAFSSGEDDGEPFVDPAISEIVVNFADNLAGPGMVVNGLLQGNLEGALTNSVRFLLNSTLGLAGLFDPADDIGLFEDETDFGQTLAVWGAPEGAYVELPVIGPSTQRDTAGRVVDLFIDPLGEFLTPDERLARTAITIAARALKRDQFGDTVDSVLHESADSYAQTRLIYLQNRRFELGEDAGVEDVDPYADLYGEE